MSIPEEAVEAAAKAMYAQDGGVGEFNLGVYEDYAKAMLEAAAPHMQPDLLEEWAVQFAVGSVEEAEDKADAERKMREIRECIQDGIESPLLEPMRVVSRYRIASTELTEWKPRP